MRADSGHNTSMATCTMGTASVAGMWHPARSSSGTVDECTIFHLLLWAAQICNCWHPSPLKRQVFSQPSSTCASVSSYKMLLEQSWCLSVGQWAGCCTEQFMAAREKTTTEEAVDHRVDLEKGNTDSSTCQVISMLWKFRGRRSKLPY